MPIETGRAIFLGIGMISTGSVNTLATKLADITSAQGIDGSSDDFDHPFVQAMAMFIGEFSCFIAYKWSQRKAVDSDEKPFPPWIFLLPAMCDMTATSLMYVGLNLTYASVYQMLRGSVVLFTGLFSVIFLKKKLQCFEIFGMLWVLAGLTLVGLASVVGSGSDDSDASNPILGDILIIIAQVIVACQMVVEEKYVAKYNVPALKAVGLEGAFGLCGISLILLIFYFIPGSSGGNHLESMPDALVQMYHSWVITIAVLGTVVSISFFNFFGLSVTKEMGATTRMVLDTVRTFVIWGISLGVGWEDFQYFQVIGFVFLLFGTVVYKKILVLPFLPKPEEGDETDNELLQIQNAEDDLDSDRNAPLMANMPHDDDESR